MEFPTSDAPLRETPDHALYGRLVLFQYHLSAFFECISLHKYLPRRFLLQNHVSDFHTPEVVHVRDCLVHFSGFFDIRRALVDV